MKINQSKRELLSSLASLGLLCAFILIGFQIGQLRRQVRILNKHAQAMDELNLIMNDMHTCAITNIIRALADSGGANPKAIGAIIDLKVDIDGFWDKESKRLE